MTINELMELVANEFENDMKEFEFESFEEMKNCYWWDSKDIRNEVDWMVNNSDTGYAMMDDSDIYLFTEDGCGDYVITYKKFINGVYKILRARGIYEEA